MRKCLPIDIIPLSELYITVCILNIVCVQIDSIYLLYIFSFETEPVGEGFRLFSEWNGINCANKNIQTGVDICSQGVQYIQTGVDIYM